MALNLFNYASSAKLFDIRLDQDYIVFRGGAREAASAYLKGVLVLCLTEPLTIKHLKLQLVGISHLSWTVTSGPLTASKKLVKERTFFEKTWKFRDAGKGKTEVLCADNYEFPFDAVLLGSLPESVEGLHDAWVTYRFKAEIGRKYAKNIYLRKPLRVIRTLDPSQMDLIYGAFVENTWPEKVAYSFSLPNKSVIFGTSVAVDFRIIPLLKGIVPGKITVQMIETHELVIPSDHPPRTRTSKSTRVIFVKSFDIGTESSLQVLEEEAEGYAISKKFDLPKTLRFCVQDADTKDLKITHKIKFRVILHNPDGHDSELRATIPVHIFISPNLPLDEHNNLVAHNDPSNVTVDSFLAQQAPPVYGEHRFDVLYSDIDPSGYFTPDVGSGVTSPFGWHSRNMSSESLVNPPGSRTENICARTLHSRLTELHVNDPGPSSRRSVEGLELPGEEPPRRPPNESRFSSLFDELDPASPDTSSTRSSEEDQSPNSSTPSARIQQIEDLCRVPSYSTALRSSAKMHYDGTLPDYRAATGSDAPSRRTLPANQSQSRRTSRLFNMRPHLTLHHRTGSNNSSDSERQIRIMQARNRE